MELYSAAASLFVTTRILTVDLLTERLRTNGDDQQVAGLIVLNAHRATDDSGEGFAVRLLRSKNKNAFVRGLSDDAGALSLGLSTLERSMRALLVSHVSFWPRFQEQVQQDVFSVDVCSHNDNLPPDELSSLSLPSEPLADTIHSSLPLVGKGKQCLFSRYLVSFRGIWNVYSCNTCRYMTCLAIFPRR